MTFASYNAFKEIRHRAPNFQPKLAIVLGSGLGELSNEIEDTIIISYHELPGFYKSSIVGHAGNLHLGRIKDVPVACLSGRAHYYEGADNNVIKTMVRTIKLLGCETWLATNAVGSLREDIKPGTLVLVRDHINFQFNNVLTGQNEDDFGPRFVSMEDSYDPHFRTQFLEIANQLKIDLPEGVYFGVLGPAFETPSEINAYRILGADIVGMSTIPEVITARHCNMRVGVISVVSNFSAGITKEKVTHEQTLRGVKLATEKLTQLILTFIQRYQIY
ncbi:purine-nucleoside phosphorylase [Coxiella endosymbiont of Amblyomma nuttalli]|uniref:purine-nucleoside phosphorylase n=1 Tax=Coxiella endosymbiont of Amblyomma nuttalli TaxID=2749996 RepID=UPI001BA64D76|nr:purine-nucleoside phosphorylase [Coxiella endosymbiont of Amblyomma nuttalli]QTS84236.1 Purine nucleoside phosphorylase 2 [Coxiella endosymbiont of Amblyomma nuttalli]